MLSSSAHSLRQKSGQPSGPGTLLGSSCDSLSNTTDGVMVMVVSGDWQTSDNWGIDVQSSTVKTLLKNSLKSWHLSWCESTVELSSIDGGTSFQVGIGIFPKLLTIKVSIVSAIKRYFDGHINESVERCNFRKCVQQCGEPFDDFLVALRELVKTCNFFSPCCITKSIRDQIIEGILNGNTIELHYNSKTWPYTQPSLCAGPKKLPRDNIQI